MTTQTHCPECGGVLDDDGLCPQCLIALGLDGLAGSGEERAEADPESIGPYRIAERLGEGGMGVVYLADQEEPIRRRVAIKVIKLGMDSREVSSRFETERQTLELMDHPGIARVLDAGTTGEGRPYFVMEYVQGIPITRYCDEKRLGTRARVELFLQVCRAVEHAHQRGVIHRDLKPSNVLVSEVDGRPVAKVIDFGVAKATAQRLTERTVFTELGRILGTPEYMSPEQARGGGLDVDTRTDVYSLGVLLYELLVGVLPFEPRELRRAGIEALLRAIREQESPRPSRRISTLGDASAEAARLRRTDPGSLARHLRGDLDWVVMRAIEKERDRRYAAVSEFSADLDRYLRQEPVLAGPPGGIYRMRKFARRHRVAITTTAALLLTAGTLVAFYTVRLQAQRDRAEREAAKARQVVKFLEGLFEGADPRETGGLELSVDDLLSRGARRLETELVHQPAVQAEIAGLLGTIYTELGEHEQARAFLEKALERRTRLFGETDSEVALALRDLARLDYKESRHEDAERRLRRALEIQAALGKSGDRETAIIRRDLGISLAMRGDLAEAIEECGGALAILESAGGEPDEVLVETLANLGYLLLRNDELTRARPMLERALRSGREVLGDRHPDLGYLLDYNAQLRRRMGDLAGAEDAAREALRIREEVLGAMHPQTIESVHNVAVILSVKGDLDAAEPLYRRALAARREIFGNEHRQVAVSLYVLAQLLERRHRLDEARPLYEEAASIQRSTQGPTHYAYARTRARLGALRVKQGDPRGAEPILREAVEVMRGALPPGHHETAMPMLWLGWALMLTERSDEAEGLLREALATREKSVPRDSPLLAEAELALAACLARLGRLDEARERFSRSAAPLLDALGPDAWLSKQVEATRTVLGQGSGRRLHQSQIPAMSGGLPPLSETS